eukprot:TRINITY_DN50954_c0_g1_i1.p1 TRINITY_DN50954_c0_g1~~TRINITY_DN50954_c0_g1_i1.p1  ORF type:complete len:204 (+),score=78.27 TRINITY_DN50954_c0_g1_i1:86-613(+)
MSRADVMARYSELQAEEDEGGDDLNTTAGGAPLSEMQQNCQFTHEDVFEVLRVIRDPEHPELSLGDLRVVRKSRIRVTYPDALFKRGEILIYLTPTVPHCAAPTHISLCVIERLQRYLPPETKWKMRLELYPGSHNDIEGINKKVNDKERICAAFENEELYSFISKLIDDEVCVN